MGEAAEGSRKLSTEEYTYSKRLNKEGDGQNIGSNGEVKPEDRRLLGWIIFK